MNNKSDIEMIEETGKRYNNIIFDEDYIPKSVYSYQINLRDNIINQCIENRIFKYVIDLGCGTGFHLKTLNKFSENLIGIDMSFGALKQCKKSIDCEYVVCDIRKLPFKNDIIDFIWVAGVLHHVPKDLNIVIRDISRILKNDGIILIDEPNKLNFFNYINMRLSKADPTGKERPVSLDSIKQLLKTNNIIVQKYDWYEFFTPIGVILQNNMIMKLLTLLDEHMHKTFLKKIQFRWYAFAYKSR